MTMHTRCLTVTALLFVGLFALVPGTSRADWTREFDEKIQWYVPTMSRVLVVGAEDGVHGLDSETGITLWMLSAKNLEQARFELLPDTPYAFVRFKKKMRGKEPFGALVDVRTGQDVWTTRALGVGKCYGHIWLSPAGVVIVHGKSSMDPKRDVAVAVDLESGRELWRVPEMFKKWHPDVYGESAQPPLFESENSVILFLNGRSLRKYRLDGGDLVWETTANLEPLTLQLDEVSLTSMWNSALEGEFEALPSSAPIYGYAPVALDEDKGILYAPYQNAVAAFRVEDGSAIWDDPYRLPGIAVQIAPVPEGLVVTTIPEETGDDKILLLNGTSGQAVWELPNSSIFSDTGVSGFYLYGDSVYVAAGGKLLAVHRPSGAVRVIAELGFEGQDRPLTLEMYEEGFLVVGFQNMAWFTPDGTRGWHVYYPAPSTSLEGLGLMLLAVSVNSLGPMDDGTGNMVEPHMSYSVGLDKFVQEYGVTAEDFQAAYMLTDPEGQDPQVVKVSKLDGSIIGRAVVDEKQPDYMIDPYLGYVYFRKNDKTVVCYQLP